jgi:hypothetical protein
VTAKTQARTVRVMSSSELITLRRAYQLPTLGDPLIGAEWAPLSLFAAEPGSGL